MASNKRTADDRLVERFVASFEKLDEMNVSDPITQQLATGDRDQHRCGRWQPIKVDTDPSVLDPIYSAVPSRFPPLFERLVLSYRWAEVDLGSYRLLANPPGTSLDALLHEMSKDPIIWNCLLEAGYIQFAKGTDIDYDPVCFDISARKKNNDCKIVKIDHEEILCHDRVKTVAELAPTFEQLMLDTIDRADHNG
jgi:hypothetical protein